MHFLVAFYAKSNKSDTSKNLCLTKGHIRVFRKLTKLAIMAILTSKALLREKI